MLSRNPRGFTLVEMAVALAILGLLLGGAIMTLSAQVDQRNHEETQRRLEAAKDALLGFAIANRRLPCPARYTSAASHSAGLESFCSAATGTCVGTETTAAQTHGNCSNFYDGYVPAVAVGLSPTDAAGFGVDAWGNRLRYAIARDVTACTATPPANTRIWTSQANLKTYGISCRPNDLDVCNTATGSGTACASAAVRVVSTQTAALIVYSMGKNAAVSATYGADETENTDGDAVFVTRTPSPSGSPAGAYDDQVLVMPVGLLYSRLISAGVLP